MTRKQKKQGKANITVEGSIGKKIIPWSPGMKIARAVHRAGIVLPVQGHVEITLNGEEASTASIVPRTATIKVRF